MRGALHWIMNMKNVVLFDMDGTLTPPRKSMNQEMVDALGLLSNYASIGIVSGSPFEYIREQCGYMFNHYNELWLRDLIIMPCNGTQKYVWENEKWEKVFSLDMREFIGKDLYRSLINELTAQQYHYALSSYAHDHVLTGNFISYRGSMVNWCPVGRDANHVDRDLFCKTDKEMNIRINACEKLIGTKKLADKLTFSIGGNTSIDIYPHGWDKRYALTHYRENEKVWFIGDRCLNKNGNDKPLYDSINKTNPNCAFQTSGPQETMELVEKIITRIANTND